MFRTNEYLVNLEYRIRLAEDMKQARLAHELKKNGGNRKSKTNMILLRILIMLAILMVSFGVSLHTTHADGTQFSFQPMSEISPDLTDSSLSLADALASDIPIVIYFYSLDACAIRYCMQPDRVAEELKAVYDQELYFLVIPFETSYREGMNRSTLPVYHNRGMWPVPPISDKLRPCQTSLDLTVWIPDRCILGTHGNTFHPFDKLFDKDHCQSSEGVSLCL